MLGSELAMVAALALAGGWVLHLAILGAETVWHALRAILRAVRALPRVTLAKRGVKR